jgi:hypothetical protein
MENVHNYAMETTAGRPISNQLLPTTGLRTLSIVASLFIASFFLSGCISSLYLKNDPLVVMFTDAYPAKDAQAIIDIYLTQSPPQPYVELAMITSRYADDATCLVQIKNKAVEMGADAVIIIGKAGLYGSRSSSRGSYSGNGYGMRAVAIRYE